MLKECWNFWFPCWKHLLKLHDICDGRIVQQNDTAICWSELGHTSILCSNAVLFFPVNAFWLCFKDYICLMLGRVSVRPSCLRTIEPSKEQQSIVKVELDSCTEKPAGHLSPMESTDATSSGFLAPAPESRNSEFGSACHEDAAVNFESSTAVSKGVSSWENELPSKADMKDAEDSGVNHNSELSSSAMEEDPRDIPVALSSGIIHEVPEDMNGIDSSSSSSSLIPVGVFDLKKDSSTALDSEAVVIEHSLDHSDTVMYESDSAVAKDIKVNGSIHSFSSEEISTKPNSLKRQPPFHDSDGEDKNGAKRAETVDSCWWQWSIIKIPNQLFIFFKQSQS